jgi:class 3 adenylate cyclase
VKRKIAAIVAADVVGYSRLMSDDEEHTLQRLQASRAVFDEFVSRYDGRIFNTAGDSVLAEFASAVEAVRCALEIQESLRTKNLGVPDDRQMLFRLGINIGDIVEREGDLLGDGVNIAARLQGLANPGGICVSRAVYEQVENKLAVGFADIGPQIVKNLPNPIHAYFVDPQLGRAPRRAATVISLRQLTLAGAAVVSLVAGGGVGAWLNSGPAQKIGVVLTAPQQPDGARSSLAPDPAKIAADASPTAMGPVVVEAVVPARQASAIASEPQSAPLVPPAVSSGDRLAFEVSVACEKLAWTPGALYQTDAKLTVKAGKVEFARPIHWPNVSDPVIGTEQGRGTMGSDGRMIVDGGWTSPRRHYTARYEGAVTTRGGTLSGKQNWVSDGKAFSRQCTLTLTKK